MRNNKAEAHISWKSFKSSLGHFIFSEQSISNSDMTLFKIC